MKLQIYIAQNYDAHKNQALEGALTETLSGDTVMLYLWANDGVVFIGKNQNAFLECNLDLLKADGGVVARRITGGGAVYHDKGNLNYSFIAPAGLYDERRQFEIILKAINSLGFNAELNGRNDLTVQGKKFSGNAFLRTKSFGLHHGTILIKSDYGKIAKYLSPGILKLKAKGVQSVAARVINLSEINPAATKEAVTAAVIKAAEDSYNTQAQYKTISDVPKAVFERWHNFTTDQNRILGTDLYYDARVEHRFDWGTCDIRLKMDKNIITAACIYSDCLDTGLVERKQRALIGQNIYDVNNEEARDIINVFVSPSF